MKRIIAGAVFMFFVTAFSAGADTMRCGDRLVSTGDTSGEVVLKCGEPFLREVVAVKRGLIERSVKPGEDIAPTDVLVEKWYYNLGQEMFIRILTFEGGVLVSVEEGDKP